MRVVLTLALALLPVAVLAGDKTTTSSTSFERCLATIQNLATKTGTAPVNIVETSIIRVVRFPAEDGSLLITCSKPDSKMIVQQSSNVCGVDVEC